MLFRSADEFGKALVLGGKTVGLMKARLGPDHPEKLCAMDRVAGAYDRAGKFDQAVPLFEEALKRWKAKLGPGHRFALYTREQLP